MSKPYFNNVPASIVGYRPTRGQISSYSGVYDNRFISTDLELQEQINSLQDDVTVIRSTFTQAQGTNDSSPNLIANGDFSQFSLGSPLVFRAAPTSATSGFIAQTRAHPIADRWFFVTQLAGFSTTDMQVNVSRVNLTSSDAPKMSSTALQIDHLTGVITTNYGTINQNINGRHGGMQGIECRIPNVRQFVGSSVKLAFWVYSNQVRKGYMRVERVYNHTRSVGTRPEPLGFEKVVLEEFQMTIGWNYITRTIDFPETLHPSMSGAIDEKYNGVMIQVGTFYHCWNSSGIMQYGDIPTAGLTLKFAEMQFSSIASEYNFPLSDKEYERTQTYVNYCSAMKPDNIVKVTSSTPGASNLSLSTAKRDNSAGNFTDFLLLYNTPLVRRPRRVIYRYWDISTQTLHTAMVFPLTDQLSSSIINAVDTTTLYNAFDPIDFRGIVLRTALYDSATSWNLVSDTATGSNEVGAVNGPNNPIQSVVAYLASQDHFPIRIWTYQLTSSKLTGSTRYIPGAATLQTNDSGSDMFGWFIAIVDEIDFGADSRTELFQIDVNAALSSLPYIH